MTWTRRYRLRRSELAIFSPPWRARGARLLSMCDRLKNGVTIIWKVRSISRCRSCYDSIGGISRNAPLTVVCGSGYRSSIAASLLESEGFDRLANVMGGMYAVRHAKRPRLPIMELADSAITWEI